MTLPARRVAFVFDFLNPGGAERAALNLASATPRSRSVVIVEWQGGELDPGDLRPTLIYASDAQRRPSRARRILALARVLRRTRPDVVVAMLSPLVVTTAARIAGVPVVHWLQAPWMQTTGAGARGARLALDRLVLLGIAYASKRVLGVSPGVLKECRRIGMPADKLAVLPNGLRLHPRRRRTVAEGRLPRLVTVGRLEAPKRHDLVLRAVATLSETLPVELHVVGAGPDRTKLESLAKQLEIADLVTFIGYVVSPHDELGWADVFVLATDYEGFGNVIVEALGEELPVVVSDVPYGPRYILGQPPLGRLVPPGSAAALAAALAAAIGDLPLDEPTRARLRERAEDFRLDQVAERFEDLLDDVLRPA